MRLAWGGGGVRDIEIKPPFVKIQDHYYRESCTLLIMYTTECVYAVLFKRVLYFELKVD